MQGGKVLQSVDYIGTSVHRAMSAVPCCMAGGWRRAGWPHAGIIIQSRDPGP